MRLQPNVAASAITSAGSAENVQMLQGGESQLAILQGLYGAMAWRGVGIYKDRPFSELRSISMLWRNVEHFLSTGSGTGIESLKGSGLRYSIGKRGSGTEGSTRVILEALGINPETDLEPEYLGYGPSAQAMMDGRIRGASIPAGPPVAAVTQAFAQLGAGNVTIMSFSEAQLASVREAYPVWTRHTLPPNTYPGQSAPVQTIAQPNILVCTSDLDEALVYDITRTLYENLHYLQNIHKATTVMSLEKAVEGLAVPIHPGAARYYREQGVSIPDSWDVAQ